MVKSKPVKLEVSRTVILPPMFPARCLSHSYQYIPSTLTLIEFAKVGSQFCSILIKSSKKIPKTFKILPKLRILPNKVTLIGILFETPLTPIVQCDQIGLLKSLTGKFFLKSSQTFVNFSGYFVKRHSLSRVHTTQYVVEFQLFRAAKYLLCN